MNFTFINFQENLTKDPLRPSGPGAFFEYKLCRALLISSKVKGAESCSDSQLEIFLGLKTSRLHLRDLNLGVKMHW